MRLIDVDKLVRYGKDNEVVFSEDIDKARTIKTKQVKYYDEDESVWKIGEVIVNSSEKPNSSTTEDCSMVGKE